MAVAVQKCYFLKPLTRALRRGPDMRPAHLSETDTDSQTASGCKL